MKKFLFVALVIVALLLGKMTFDRLTQQMQTNDVNDVSETDLHAYKMVQLTDTLIIPVKADLPIYTRIMQHSPSLSKPLFSQEEFIFFSSIDPLSTMDAENAEKEFSIVKYLLYKDLAKDAVRFFGRILDQDNRPVSHAYIKISSRDTSELSILGDNSTTRYAYARTDLDGRFALFGINQDSSIHMFDALTKDGYLFHPLNYYDGQRRLKSNSFEHPLTINAWKINLVELEKNSIENNIQSLKIRAKLPTDPEGIYVASLSLEHSLNKNYLWSNSQDTYLTAKFLKTDAIKDADVVLKLKHQYEENENTNEGDLEFSGYEVNLLFKNHKIQEQEGVFAYKAPDDGYSSEINFQIDNSHPEWEDYKHSYKKKLYLKSNAGDFYGVLDFVLYPRNSNGSARVNFSGDVNVAGSPYLLRASRKAEREQRYADSCKECWE